MNGAHRFGLIDWTVLAVYAVALLTIGFRLSRRERTNQDFFLGSRRARPFLAGISLFAALFSIISYTGTPGEFIQHGPVLPLLANVMIIPFLYLIVGWGLIPAIMRLPITSAYELLEARLGGGVRQAGSLTYVVTRLLWMSLILFVSSTVLENVIGCGPGWGGLIILVIGAITTTYTMFGGIRTVMITEAIQFFMLLAGALLTIVSVSWRLGGISSWWPTHWESHWAAQPFFSADPRTRVSIVWAFLAWLFVAISSAGSDQAAIQRFLTTRDPVAARRAYLLSICAVACVSALLALVGAAVLGYFQANPGAIPPGLSFAANGDAFFPLYISRYLPAGISGLVVASLLAAAMSCLSSGITATVTVVTKDFVESMKSSARRSEAARMRLTHGLVVLVGAIVMAGGLSMGAVKGNIFEVMGKTADLLACPVFGLFFLAIFVRFATPFGAVLGAVYSISAAVLVGYWDTLTGGPHITFLWIAPIAMTVSLSAGCIFSLVPTRGRRLSLLAAYGAAALAPLVAILAWLIR